MKELSLLHALALFVGAMIAPSAAAAPSDIRAGAVYVAMGSSFASGPGIGQQADAPPTRCARSADNYAHQLAATRNLALTDVTCSGATTAHILGPWNELPPQIDAITEAARLVTITIGGNDVGYIGGLIATSCAKVGLPGRACPPPSAIKPDWEKLEAQLRQIVRTVRARAPKAQIIFVDYLTVLPETGPCAATPLLPEEAKAARAMAKRLADLTATVARAEGARILTASQLSAQHSVCDAAPWMNGFPLPGMAPFVPYHPNKAGMTAVAQALDAMLGK